ncbi:hypothetical protein [Serratia marcescens]|uniref:hypothetical protein n=1 Tax=Serratia marcescens TaxID=615 RepID=UPI001BD4B484|nr:hypothetical protein [Serratia marcescens]
MATTPTTNPVPSESVQDLKFNAGKVDQIVNSDDEFYYDRLGVKRYTIQGIINNISLLGRPYATLDLAIADIASGVIKNNAVFSVVSADDNRVIDLYVNNNGVANYTGKSEIDASFVQALSLSVEYLKLIVPRSQENLVTGYQVLFTDVSGKIGLLGINDGGGLEIPGMTGNVQSYLTNLVSDSFSSKIDGYQFVFLSADNKTAVAAIDDDGYFWLAGMDEPVQTAIANSGGKGSERLARPDGTGKIALFASEDDTTPLWSRSPVVSAEKVTDTGISFVYNDSGVLKSALIPTTPLQNAVTETIREMNNHSQEMHYFAGRGQSLRVGANGGQVASLLALQGYLLMFSGSGKDRGAGIDGAVTDELLGALADARIINFRNNCQVPAGETILLNHQARNAAMPIIVTRLDARGGFNYNQLKKGTQPYIDGTTSFDAFCKRAEAIGKKPICKLIGFTHGEADANKSSLQFGEYKGYLVEWSNDTQADMMERSGQTEKPWLDVDQVGSLTNTTVINGITQRGYVVAIDQWEFTKERTEAFMSIPKWLLNRLYPQDFLHLTGIGYRILGEYHGLAEDWTIYDRVNNPSGAKFKPVQPESIAKVNATTFDITFSSPYGKPLQVKPVNGITAPNLGIDLQNGSANITSVTQQSNFVFRVVTDVAPAVGDYFRFGCTATDNGANSYPLINIFDTTTTVSRYDPAFVLENPCAISRIAVI